MSATPVLSAAHLRAGYRGHPVLHDVSFELALGDCVAVTGSNGSGKSTLLKTLIGAIPIMAGTAQVLGQRRDSQGSEGPDPWYQVGYVPQRQPVAAGIGSTVLEVVQSGLLGSGHLRLPRSWRSDVQQSLSTVGMAHRRREPFQNLSGGQQQRVLIARALVRKPRILLFDEPLTGLDDHNRRRLAQIIAESVRTECTAVLVLHELGELRPVIGREIRLSRGHVVHDGPCTHDRHDAQTGAWWDHEVDTTGSEGAGTGVWGGVGV